MTDINFEALVAEANALARASLHYKTNDGLIAMESSEAHARDELVAMLHEQLHEGLVSPEAVMELTKESQGLTFAERQRLVTERIVDELLKRDFIELLDSHRLSEITLARVIDRTITDPEWRISHTWANHFGPYKLEVINKAICARIAARVKGDSEEEIANKLHTATQEDTLGFIRLILDAKTDDLLTLVGDDEETLCELLLMCYTDVHKAWA